MLSSRRGRWVVITRDYLESANCRSRVYARNPDTEMRADPNGEALLRAPGVEVYDPHAVGSREPQCTTLRIKWRDQHPADRTIRVLYPKRQAAHRLLTDPLLGVAPTLDDQVLSISQDSLRLDVPPHHVAPVRDRRRALDSLDAQIGCKTIQQRACDVLVGAPLARERRPSAPM